MRNTNGLVISHLLYCGTYHDDDDEATAIRSDKRKIRQKQEFKRK